MTLSISTQVFDNVDDLPNEKWGLGFYGKSLDERGRCAIESIADRSIKSIEIDHRFSNESQIYSINGSEVGSPVKHLQSLIKKNSKNKRVLLDATTLGLPEIAAICLSIKQLPDLECALTILYIEPHDYKRKSGEARKFHLSTDRKFSNIIGLTLDTTQLDPGTVIAFLGFEPERLAHFEEQFPATGWDGMAFFGVPAFKAGWESDAYTANVPTLSKRDANIAWDVNFCSANSVSAAYFELMKKAEGRDLNERPFLFLPIGTKPHGIAAVLFCCEHSYGRSGITYDHPVRIEKRTEQIGKSHLYHIAF
tara:strand:+ start:98 stop:1021 length:924 start_codon:yes stop_codon:yes gene_type:complete